MVQDTWTIKRCLDWTRDYLRGKGDERPRVSAEWLLSHVTGLSRTMLYVSFDKPMSSEELSAMHAAVVRRAKGEPLQYITGETSFRGIAVACEPGVLIPRPETELLVEEVLGYLDREVLGAQAALPRTRVELPWNDEVEQARKAELAAIRAKEERADAPDQGDEHASDESNLSDAPAAASEDDAIEGEAVAPEDSSAVLDKAGDEAAPMGDSRLARVLEVGCGTGCISLSLASEREGRVECVAIDIEQRAVDLTMRNRDSLGLPARAVDVRRGNLVSPLNRETEWGTFDVLVSNPPYIPTNVMETLPHEVVDYEPALALDGGVDGLDIFRRLVNAAPHMLRSGGLLACELYEGHLDAAAELCRKAGMQDVSVVEDFAGRPRIVLARV